MKKVRHLFFVSVLAGLLILGCGGYWIYTNIKHKVSEDVVVLVPPGVGVRQVAGLLEEARVIKSRYFFEVYVRFSKESGTLKLGEYEFKKNEGVGAVLAKLVSGDTKKYKFTHPEGQRMWDMCRTMIKKQMIDIFTCLDLVSDTTLIKEHDPEAKTLEGYLFPDTYTYDALLTQQEFIDSMVQLFIKKILTPERQEKIKKSGKTLREVVILASIVEKETGVAPERPIIASVFLNRLKTGMPLQSDPTVIYGISQFNGNLTKKDLQTDSPFNTYTRKGLPLGPISNPGEDAIDAVLSPAQTEYLYFVAKGDGSHYFSRTLEEHNRAVQHYQLKRGAPPPPVLP